MADYVKKISYKVDMDEATKKSRKLKNELNTTGKARFESFKNGNKDFDKYLNDYKDKYKAVVVDVQKSLDSLGIDEATKKQILDRQDSLLEKTDSQYKNELAIKEIDERLAVLKKRNTEASKAEAEVWEEQKSRLEKIVALQEEARKPKPIEPPPPSEQEKLKNDRAGMWKDFGNDRAKTLFNPLDDKDLPDDFKELSPASKALVYSFKSVSDSAVDLAGTIKDKVIETMKNLWKNGKAIVEDMATYNLSGSNKYNSSAWDLAEQTGLTGANLYGLQQALKKQGFNSYDDYLDNQYRLSDSARSEMQEEMDKAVTEWNKLNDSGYFEKVQEFDEEWADFKRDLQYAFIDFFIGNKDIIEGALQTAIDVLPSILSAINAIVGFFGTSASYKGISSGVTSDIINNYSGGSKTTNNSVVFNTNVSASGGTSDAESWQRVQSQMFNQYIRNRG